MERDARKAVPSAPSRRQKSLSFLTMKFVRLLKEAEDGVLDLKVAADILVMNTKQKRRIYDILNVLEGVGLIQKKSKNLIQWRGVTQGSQSPEALQQLKILKGQIGDLEAQERNLDEQMATVQDDIDCFRRDPPNKSFVTHEDICDTFSSYTVLTIEALEGTQLLASFNTVEDDLMKFQMRLRSLSAPIHITHHSTNSDRQLSAAFTVPPDPLSPRLPPLPAAACCSSSAYNSSQESLGSSQQVALSDSDELLPLSPPDELLVALENQQQMDPDCFELPSLLGVSGLLKFGVAAEQMNLQYGETHAEAVNLKDEFLSADDTDYSYNLDDSDELFDELNMQLLHY